MKTEPAPADARPAAEPDLAMHKSIVVDLPGRPVAAPCAIDGCQFMRAEQAEARLAHLVEGLTTLEQTNRHKMIVCRHEIKEEQKQGHAVTVARWQGQLSAYGRNADEVLALIAAAKQEQT